MELIDRQVLIDSINDKMYLSDGCRAAVIEVIKSASKLEIIQCKDCVYWAKDFYTVNLSDGSVYCPTMDDATLPDEYCSRAERREE